jgi:hypothetical protein
MMDFPAVVFAVCVLGLWFAAHCGALWCRKRRLDDDERADLSVVLTAALTLLGLIIGFTFSMAITRYDQRKACEATEANTIGTEFNRAGLLPPADAARVRDLLKRYVQQRVLFYTTRDANRLRQIAAATTQLQTDLWTAVQDRAPSLPVSAATLVLSGMNAVLDAQGYAQAAWWNRIPGAAWILMVTIALCCSGLFGYTSHQFERESMPFFILPLIVAISFFLIADIDSPRGGVVLIHPQNLESVAASVQIR